MMTTTGSRPETVCKKKPMTMTATLMTEWTTDGMADAAVIGQCAASQGVADQVSR